MLLRKLVAALCPVLLCLLVCGMFQWLDGLMPSGFFLFALKGLLLGLCIALILPVAGITSRTNGLSHWLLVGAGVLLIMLAYQYLESAGIVRVPLLRALLTINGQVILVESAVMGFMALTSALNWKR